MLLENCNPYLRAAEIQPAILEGSGPRKAYDHRLFYVLDNTGTMIIEGSAHTLGPHSLILLPPAVEYYFIGKLRTVVINFDLTRQQSCRRQPICPPPVESFDPALLFDRETVPGLEVPYIGRGDLFIRDAVVRIVEEFGAGDNRSDALTSALLKALLAELLLRANQEDTLCKKVLAYIRAHAPLITDNGQIAKAFGYHPVYLGELFRQATGKTLHNAVTDEKLALACRWLERTDSSIADIAESCGFCSRTHFCTLFKKKMGLSPSEYRAKMAATV